MTIKAKLTVLSLIVVVLATSFVTVFADSVEVKKEVKKAELLQKLEQKEMLKEALENGDYDVIAEKHQERTGEELSEEQFGLMQEAHTMMQEGNREGAKALFEEAGVKLQNMQKLKKMEKKSYNLNCKCGLGNAE